MSGDEKAGSDTEEGKSTVKEPFKSRMENFGEDTDVHGVKYIVRSDSSKAKKIVWLILLMFAMGYMSFEIIGRFLYYFEYPHVTKVDVLYTNNLEFPAVTICNMNKYRRRALTDTDLLHMGKEIGILDENMKLHHEDHYNATFVQWVHSMNWSAVRDRGDTFDVEEFTKRTGHQKEDMILYCKWKGELCGADNFTHVFTHLGNCYTFNIEHLSKFESRKAGAGNGLKLFINVEEFDYLESADAADDGLKILIHGQEEPPFVKELGYGIMPGQHHFLGLRKMEVINLPEPYGNCAVDHPMTMFDHYNIPSCRIQCETQQVVDECGCRLPEMPAKSNASICTPIQLIDCADPKIERISETDTCTCQLPCNTVAYQYYPSSVKLRAETLDKLKSLDAHLPQHLTIDEIVALNIYFEALSFETIEQTVAYPWPSLLGDIGGQMGLFIGASVLTFLHAIEFFVDEIGKCVAKRKQAKVNANGNDAKADMPKVEA